MKTRLLILTIATFIVAQTVFAQSAERQVTFIRGEVTAINKSAKGYKKTVKSVEGFSLEGTEATYFSSGKGLRKIAAQIYGESFKATLELYYSGDELIFAYEKMGKYNGTIGMKNLKVGRVEERRFYLTNGKMIRYLRGQKSVSTTSNEFADGEKEILETDGLLRAAFAK